MKFSIYSMFFLFFGYFVLACSTPKNVIYQRSGKVICQQYEEGVIHLMAEANAESLAKAVGFAERNAIENLLFKGIPSSNQEKPMINNETEAVQKHSNYFHELIDQGRYHRFVMKSEVAESFKEDNSFFIKHKISVDLKALRTDLEQHNIVRKFGL